MADSYYKSPPLVPQIIGPCPVCGGQHSKRRCSDLPFPAREDEVKPTAVEVRLSKRED